MLQIEGVVRGAAVSNTGGHAARGPGALACKSWLAVLVLALAAPLVHAAPVEVDADIIWDNADAANKCPQLCSAKHLYWMGTWHKTGWAETPVCACDDHPQPPPPQLPPGAPGFPQGLPGMPQMAPVAPPPMQNGAVLRYENTDFPGFDLRNFSAGSFENCADMCGASADCRAFTYAADQHRCYLKSADQPQPARRKRQLGRYPGARFAATRRLSRRHARRLCTDAAADGHVVQRGWDAQVSRLFGELCAGAEGGLRPGRGGRNQLVRAQRFVQVFMTVAAV